MFVKYGNGNDRDTGNGGTVFDRAEYLSWQERTLAAGCVFDDTLYEVAMQAGADRTEMLAAGGNYGHGLASFIGISSIAAFIMTVTIIVLIMQGNKRSFYHERVSHMQSGMIVLMAEIVENRNDNTRGNTALCEDYGSGGCIDTLTSRRCYKNAMPLEKVYVIIREESGTHFDPVVVEAFFAAMEGIGGKEMNPVI